MRSMKIIICATFIAVFSISTLSYANELTLKEISADLKQATQHYNYGLETQEKKTLKLARVSQENKAQKENKTQDLEAQYFDNVNTARAGRKRVRE